MITKGYVVRCDKCGRIQNVDEIKIDTIGPNGLEAYLTEKCGGWEIGLQPHKRLIVDLCPECSAEYLSLIRKMFPITMGESKKKVTKVQEVMT